MYKVKCLARGKVILGDLGITLNNGETVDLDNRFTRAVLDGSHNLNTAIHKEHLAVLHKDVEKPADMSMVFALEQRLRESILEEMRAQKQEVVPPVQAQVQPDTSDLHTKIDALIAAMGQKPVDKKDAPSAIDDSKAIDIHTRTVERLTRGVTSQVNVQSTNKNSEVAQRAKELEDLM